MSKEEKKVLTIKEWEELIRRNKYHKVYDVEQKRDWNRLARTLRKLVPIPVVLGFIASFITVKLYGWNELIKTVLGWVVGMTLITALIVGFMGKIQQILKN